MADYNLGMYYSFFVKQKIWIRTNTLHLFKYKIHRNIENNYIYMDYAKYIFLYLKCMAWIFTACRLLVFKTIEGIFQSNTLFCLRWRNLIFFKYFYNPLVPLGNCRSRYNTKGVCVKIIQRTKKLNW